MSELLYQILDALVDEYFPMLDALTNRSEEIGIFLPLNFVTGFFGMNFARLAGASDAVFAAAIVAMVFLPIAMLWLIRRQKIG